MDIFRGRKRNFPHKRSKKGCLSCRKRRKKCPEDYQQWSDGSWACSACEVRGQKCNLPLSKKGRQQQQQQQSTNIITSQSPSQLDHVQQQNVSSSLLEDASNIVYGTEHSVSLNRPSDAVISESKQTPFSTHLANNDTSFYHRQSVSTETSAGEPDKNAWLDTFLEEFMALTEPSLQTIVQPTLTPISSSSPALDLLSIAKSPKSNTRNEQNRPESVMDRMIRSDDLDDLLTKSAHIYDTFLCAIIDTSKIAGNASLIDHLMDITKSNNVCKASMVSCCLAYKDVIDRERQSPRGPSRFVQYLIKGSRKAPTISTIPSRQVHQWLKYATDGFHQSKLTMNLAAKLLTLLNLRFACICFSGARDAFALANDIHSVLCQLRVDVHYLRSTARKGTPLSVIIQALAFANIMDAATMKGVRPAILNESREMASALEVDLAVNPRADLKMVTVLSVELVDCIKRISDLSVDIAEGQLHHRSEIESKGEEIKQLIMQSVVDMPSDICQATARVRTFLLQELWRQALLIQLYQDVLKLGPMAVRVQQALQSIIRLAELLAKTEEGNLSYIDVWDMSFVWFLACTVAISEENRTFCLNQLEHLGCERAILDNIEAIKILWKDMDETGRSTEWRDVLSEHGLVINYTF